MKLLIGYEGSEAGDAVLLDLPFAGLGNAVEARVVTAADVWLPEAQTSTGQATGTIAKAHMASSWLDQSLEHAYAHARAELHRAWETARHAQARLQALYPTWHVEAEACADSPAWALIKRADAWKPDLLCVGAHNRHGLQAFLLGSVSQTVVREARCSVRIARPRHLPEGQPLHLLIGMDGSQEAEAAVQTIESRQWPAGTEVCVLTAVDPMLSTAAPLLPPSEGEQIATASPRAAFQTLLDSVETRLTRCGLHVTTLLAESDPRDTLLAQANEWPADTIFVGAHGLRGLERLLLGSVSCVVCTRAHCSVEVIRMPEASL